MNIRQFLLTGIFSVLIFNLGPLHASEVVTAKNKVVKALKRLDDAPSTGAGGQQQPRLEVVRNYDGSTIGGNGITAAGCNAIPPGLVDTLIARVDDFELLRYVGIPPQDEDVYFQVSSLDPSIVAAVDNRTGTQNPRVKVSQGLTYSEVFKVRGVKVGSTTIQGVPQFGGVGVINTSVGAWELEGIVDFNGLSGGSRCYDTMDPTNPHPTISTRVNCSEETEAVSADGISRLLMRLESGLDGKGCFKVVSDAPPLQGSTTPVDDIPSEPYAGDHWVFSTFEPPAEYEETSSKTREVEIEIAFTPKDNSGGYVLTNTSTYRTKIEIRRPPVLLLHGVWSDSGTWSNGFLEPSPEDGRIIKAGNYPNAEHFSENARKISDLGKALIRKSRRQKVATTQIDVIAHSMGGLLTRNWMVSPDFVYFDNFNEGYVRKLITLHTPHHGSQFANMLINVHNNFFHVGFVTKIGLLETVLPGEVHRGAICDLAENSRGIAFPGYSNVLTYVYTGTAGSVNAISGALGTAIDWIFSDNDFPDHVNPYLFQEPNDGIVAFYSQSDNGRINGINAVDLVHSGGLGGSAVTSSNSTASSAFTRLDSDSGFTTSGLQAVGSNGDGVPRMGIGRGPAIDALNYQLQCDAGRPMAQGTINEDPTPGITIVEPIQDALVAPGDVIPVIVDVDPVLQPEQMILLADMESGILPQVIPALPFEGTVTIPQDWAGPLLLSVGVRDVNGQFVGGSSVTVQVVPAELPQSIAAISGSMHFDITAGGTPSEQISVRGTYLDGTQRDLTAAATGTIYTSSDVSVATVSADGLVTPLLPGNIFIDIDHQGVKTYVEVEIYEPGVDLPAIDQTANVTIEGSGFRLDRETGNFVQNVSITNDALVPLTFPLHLVLEDLPAGVTFVNEDGLTTVVTPLGSPYIFLESGEPDFFSPGSAVTLRFEFLNLLGVPISYTPKLYTVSKP